MKFFMKKKYSYIIILCIFMINGCSSVKVGLTLKKKKKKKKFLKKKICAKKFGKKKKKKIKKNKIERK